MNAREIETLLSQLAGMPDFLQAILGGLSPADARRAGPDGSFSPVEQCWHLADLEREGYAVRIRRLLTESDPVLADFDGAGVAAERQYKTLSLDGGIRAFREARFANLQVLRALSSDAWSRSGTQEGIGAVALGDIPALMAEHDDGHRREIEAWVEKRRAAAGPG